MKKLSYIYDRGRLQLTKNSDPPPKWQWLLEIINYRLLMEKAEYIHSSMILLFRLLVVVEKKGNKKGQRLLKV